jgi:arylsulfatase
MVDHVPQLYLAQEVVAEQIADFIKFPPRQKPAAFNLDAVLAQLGPAIKAEKEAEAGKAAKAEHRELTHAK